MNKSIQVILIVMGSLLIAALMLGIGWFIGQQGFLRASWQDGMMGGRFSGPSFQDWDAGRDIGSGAICQSPMGSRNPGMMGRISPLSRDDYRGSFLMGQGMMGRGFSGSQAAATPPTMEQAQSAFENYLEPFENDDLAIHEIMIFENNAYAIVIEESTGMGAMELLLDPATMQVFPEYGPNHMWNLKYGMMGEGNLCSRGRFCNTDGFPSPLEDISANMAITAEQAADDAQDYLDNAAPGATVAEEGMAFYGYYTFDYQIDGEMAGMLSVNGETGQAWLHTWHGNFIEEQDFD